MPVRILFVTLCLAAFCISPARAAEFKPEVIKAAKRATAAVISDGRQVATAFCIAEAGYFLTSDIVTPFRGPLQLWLDPGETEERLVKASIVRSWKEGELVLLRTIKPGKFASLDLAEAELIETQQLLVVGYPEGSSPPKIAVARIAAILKERGETHLIELDTRAGAGNSGGPLLNEAGRVVGVQTQLLGRKAVSLALPARRALQFLEKPDVELSLDAIPFAQRHQPQTLTARVASFRANPPEFAVRLKLGEGSAAREIELKREANGAFAAKTPLVERQKANTVPIEIAFANGGLIRGLMDDVVLKPTKAGGKLSELARIERRGDRWTLVGTNGEEHPAEKLSLKKVQLGAAAIEVPWQEARTVTIFSESDEPSFVPYELIVIADGKPVLSRQGQIAITGRPPSFDREAAAGDFVALDGTVRWPAAFDAPPIATGSTGLKGLGRRYVRTTRGDLLDKDFSWELVFTIAKDDAIVFIGLGEGRSEQHEGEPGKSVNFRIHSEEVSHGEVVLTKSGPIGGQFVGKIPAGTHRAVIRKRGDRVTFAIDVGNNGASPDDIEQTVPDLRGFAPFLTEKNTYLFFGGGGTFQKMRLVEGAPRER